MIYNENNLEYCMAAPREIYVQWRDEHSARGFRHISLSLSGPLSVPIYSAVMVKRVQPFRERSWPGLDKDSLSAKIDELAAADEPLHPCLITATGSGSNVLYAACFRRMDRAPRVRLNMFPAMYASENEAQRAAGRIPIWIDSFGTPQDVRYCAIWADNPEAVAWSAEAINDVEPRRQQRFDALNSIGARPALVAMTPAPGTAQLFVDNRLKHGWHSRADMSGDSFSTAIDEQKGSGRFPVQIAATVALDEVRYSAIFAKSDEILPRSFRARGPLRDDLPAAERSKAGVLNDWMERYVKAHKLRGAALAVVLGTRLVYAKGYTWAEADYPDIEPTTLFRQASVSKTYCAVAIWALLARSPSGLGSKMQSLLNLTQPNGSAPRDPDFSKITIRQLLESESGIKQDAVWDCLNIVRNSNAAQPLTAAEAARMIAGMDMPHAPGGETVYGNTDYFMLSQLVAKLAGKTSFWAGLKESLLDPLHMTRTQLARSKVEQQFWSHTRHHLGHLPTTFSAVHADRRLVPWQYGGDNCELLEGTGGLSAAVIDVARLCAMFSCRIDNPVLEPAIIDAMLDAAVTATNTGSGAAGDLHGYHGMDFARYANAARDRVVLDKGGALPGSRTGFNGTTHERFVVIARNGEPVAGALPSDWKNELGAIVDTVDWGGRDLFPEFGMPSLGLRAKPKPGPAQRTAKIKPFNPAR